MEWKLIKSRYVFDKDNVLIADTFADTAEPYSMPDKSQRRANNRLIVNAPEMYVSLIALLACCELNLDEMEPETIACIERARAVIAKVRR